MWKLFGKWKNDLEILLGKYKQIESVVLLYIVYMINIQYV